MKRHVVLVLGPSREAMPLGARFQLLHFQAASAIALAAAIVRHDVELVHIDASLDATVRWRDLVSLAVAKLFIARVVYQVHPDALRAGAANPLVGALARRMLRWPDAVVIANGSDGARRDFFGLYGGLCA